MSFRELQDLYSKYFSLGNLNNTAERSAIENRMILISLVCYVTYKTKLKHPDTTHYSVIMKLSAGLGLPDTFIKGLSIICEDFSYNCTSFPTFGLEGQDIVKEIVKIFKSYLPF